MAKRTNIDVYKDLVEPRLNEIKIWFMSGFSLSKIADKLGVSKAHFWQLTQDENKQALKNALAWGEISNLNVETALYNKAVGHYIPIKRAIKLKKVYWDEMGRKCEKEEIAMVEELQYYPPDFNAQRFWLGNRMSGKWKYEQQFEATTNELLEKADNIVVKIKQLATAGDKAPVQPNITEPDANE